MVKKHAVDLSRTIKVNITSNTYPHQVPLDMMLWEAHYLCSVPPKSTGRPFHNEKSPQKPTLRHMVQNNRWAPFPSVQVVETKKN